MSKFQLSTPVAFIIFNRPDTTEKVFAEIARARPPKLLVIGDGPRTSRDGEAEKVTACRAIIDRVDWPCEVLTNYSEANLGCKARVSSGLDWVFEQVPEAIILEDDCLPHHTFFQFCEEMLKYYRNDTRIGLICGTHLLFDKTTDDSYYFSRYPHIWGWASWSRVWKYYDVGFKNLDMLIEDKNFEKNFKSINEYKHWIDCFKKVRDGFINTWDAQVVYLTLIQSMLSIYPSRNLISNIGFGENATHTTNNKSPVAELETFTMDFPLRHPNYIYPNYKAESYRKTIEQIGLGILKKIKIRILNKLGKI
jgi:hypothetical protein